MGFFSELFVGTNTPKESLAEIQYKINTSPTSEKFRDFLLQNLSQGSEWCDYLLEDTKHHSIFIKFSKQGISVRFMNFHPRFYKANNTYTYAQKGIGFSASGFTDLPNSNYVLAFESYIVKSLQENCVHLNIRTDDSVIIEYKESAKKGW